MADHTTDDDPGYTAWESGTCTYSCNMCAIEFPDSGAHWAHVKDYHRMPVASYRIVNPEPCVNRETFDCALCVGRTVEHDRFKMEVHFHKKHPNVTMRTYYEKYVKEKKRGDGKEGGRKRAATKAAAAATSRQDDIPDAVDPVEVKVEAKEATSTKSRPAAKKRRSVPSSRQASRGTSSPEWSTSCPTPALPSPLPESLVEPTLSVGPVIPSSTSFFGGAAWYDGCEYQCILCPYANDATSHLSNHMRTYHKVRGEKNVNFSVVREDFLDCKLCRKSVYRSQLLIKQHLMHKHKISLEEYEARYVFGDEDPPLSVSSLGLSPPSRGKGEMWYNGCAYNCLGCNHIAWDRKNVSHHAKTCRAYGGVATKKPAERVGTLVENIYRCKICNFALRHDLTSIAEHLDHHHKLKIPDYAAVHEANF